jgi:hypothetical protein
LLTVLVLEGVSLAPPWLTTGVGNILPEPSVAGFWGTGMTVMAELKTVKDGEGGDGGSSRAEVEGEEDGGTAGQREEDAEVPAKVSEEEGSLGAGDEGIDGGDFGTKIDNSSRDEASVVVVDANEDLDVVWLNEGWETEG